MTPQVVTFGEIMLRLSPPGHQRFLQCASFEVAFGGGEANVAVALAQLGLPSAFVSKLPGHELGERALQELRRAGVETRHILRGGERLGIYFLENGASQRASRVLYDRARSAVTTLEPGAIDWGRAFEGARWFHWTGITPALGSRLPEVVAEACQAAKARGLTVSADLNYRRKLWSPEEAQACLIPLMRHVDLCIANEEDAQHCLGLSAGQSRVEQGALDPEGYAELARSLRQRFGFRAVAITLRESHGASRNGWSALMLDDGACASPTRSRQYDVWIVDRVGAGDSFAAGLIYGLLRLEDSRQALEFAAAASCLKQTIPGDFNLVSASEVLALARGGGGGRVER